MRRLCAKVIHVDVVRQWAYLQHVGAGLGGVVEGVVGLDVGPGDVGAQAHAEQFHQLRVIVLDGDMQRVHTFRMARRRQNSAQQQGCTIRASWTERHEIK